MKVILTIAAGRRLSMSGLIPQLLKQEGWDELHIWINTKEDDDVAFLVKLPELDTRIRLKFIKPEVLEEGSGGTLVKFEKAGNLGKWWPENCTDPDAIYVRFDDDIVFVEEGTVKALVEARLQNPDPYLIFPVIINNGVLAHYLEQEGKIKDPDGHGYTPYVFDPLIWSGEKCIDIHEQFLDVAAEQGPEYFHINNYMIDPQHVSINCMCYFGKDIAQWGGEFGLNGEEGFITCQVPYWNKRGLMIMGSKVVSHLAFAPQRAHWEGGTDPAEVGTYTNCLQKGLPIDRNLQSRIQFDEDFRDKVVKRIELWNKHLTVLEKYRSLHSKLYDIDAFPISHSTWDWPDILAEIQYRKHNHNNEGTK